MVTLISRMASAWAARVIAIRRSRSSSRVMIATTSATVTKRKTWPSAGSNEDTPRATPYSSDAPSATNSEAKGPDRMAPAITTRYQARIAGLPEPWVMKSIADPRLKSMTSVAQVTQARGRQRRISASERARLASAASTSRGAVATTRGRLAWAATMSVKTTRKSQRNQLAMRSPTKRRSPPRCWSIARARTSCQRSISWLRPGLLFTGPARLAVRAPKCADRTLHLQGPCVLP